MRELKFRAWNKIRKIMSYDVTLYANGWVKCVFEDGTEEKFPPKIAKEILVIMQYIGLKDENGKEIYEGDIIRCYGGAYWNGIYEYNYVIEVRDIRDLNDIVHSENVKILGNKYENPELLKGRE